MVQVWQTRTDLDSVTDQELSVGAEGETKLKDRLRTGELGKGGSGPGNADAMTGRTGGRYITDSYRSAINNPMRLLPQ